MHPPPSAPFNPPPFPEPSKPPETWTLATYNVQDLFDTTDDPRAEDERPTENRLQNKFTRLRRVLHILDADVVGLMEVETLAVLRRLNDEHLRDLGYRETILIEGNDPERGIDVALLSRFSVAHVVSHAGETFSDADGHTRRIFSRDCLECHIILPSGETLVVLVNHFKSKRGGEEETEALRERQAARVRVLAENLSRLHPLVAIVGDLNDTPDSPPLRLLTAQLSDILSDVPATHRATFMHAGQPERIDYLLAAPALAARFVPGSVLIPHDIWPKKASDHSPVRATFGDAPPLFENFTVRYDTLHPPVSRVRTPARINAARFLVHSLHPLQGQLVIVTGIVRRAQVTAGDGVIRLFLGHGDPARAFRAVVFPDVRAVFADVGIADIAGYYTGRLVQGVGRLGFYQNAPEIAIETPGQLKVIQ